MLLPIEANLSRSCNSIRYLYPGEESVGVAIRIGWIAALMHSDTVQELIE